MKNLYDVVIIGGSHAGLSAALVLGRSLRKVLVLDKGKPRNFAADQSHGFYTRDGENPLTLLKIAKEEIKLYENVSIRSSAASALLKNGDRFEIQTGQDRIYSRRIILAAGVKDVFPEIKGFADLWGKNIFNCPYCHGWELRNSRAAVIANDNKTDYPMFIFHWLTDLTLFAQGFSFTEDETAKLKSKNIRIINAVIDELKKTERGKCEVFYAGNNQVFDGIFIKTKVSFNNELAASAGCSIGESGEVLVDEFQETSVKGIYAAGDITRPHFHQIAVAAASGMQAAISVNSSLL